MILIWCQFSLTACVTIYRLLFDALNFKLFRNSLITCHSGKLFDVLERSSLTIVCVTNINCCLVVIFVSLEIYLVKWIQFAENLHDFFFESTKIILMRISIYLIYISWSATINKILKLGYFIFIINTWYKHCGDFH